MSSRALNLRVPRFRQRLRLLPTLRLAELRGCTRSDCAYYTGEQTANMRANVGRGPLRLVFALVTAAAALLRAEAAGDGQLYYARVLLEPNGGRAYELPALPFAYAALEPHIDEATVRVHHDGHQRAYTDNMNALLAQWRAQVSLPTRPASAVHFTPLHFRTELNCTGSGV